MMLVVNVHGVTGVSNCSTSIVTLHGRDIVAGPLGFWVGKGERKVAVRLCAYVYVILFKFPSQTFDLISERCIWSFAMLNLCL